MQDLAVVCTFFPLPLDRGDPIRVLMTLEAIARVRPFTLLVVRRPDTTPELEDELRARLPNVRVEVFSSTPYALNAAGPAGRFTEARVGGMPPWVRTRYSKELHARLRTMRGAGLAIGEAAAAYFAETGLSWHWDKANVLAVSVDMDVADEESLQQRLRARYLAGESRTFEKAAMRRVSSISVTSSAEAERLRTFYGRDADYVLPSSVALPPPLARAPEPGHLVWLSSFNYRPNLLGLERFLSEAWEPLRRAGFRLTAAGSGSSPGVAGALEVYEGVTVAGFVEDLGPLFARAHAAIVPLWSGAGVKLKTLTLLSHAVPVFTTPVGAEGLPTTEAIGLGGTPQELASLILAASPEDLARMSWCGRDLIADEFSEQRFGERLIDALGRLGLIGTPACHRAPED